MDKHSKEYFEHRQCRRKQVYSKKVALQRAALSSKQTGTVIRAYKCLVCNKWHIGHPDIKARMEHVLGKVNRKLKTINKRRLRAGDTNSPNPESDQNYNGNA